MSNFGPEVSLHPIFYPQSVLASHVAFRLLPDCDQQLTLVSYNHGHNISLT